MDSKLTYYRFMFAKLRQGGGSLAKPIFLISIIDAIEKQFIKNNKIYYSNWLKEIYVHNYSLFCKTDESTPMKYPFYYLRNDGFYYLEHTIDESKFPKTPSLHFLNEYIPYAYFDDDLWVLLQDATCRDNLRNVLIQIYLHKKK